MRASTSVWSRYAHRLFGNPQATTPLRRAGRRVHRLGFERMEDRTVLSASFGGAAAIDVAAQDFAADQAGNTIMSGFFSGTVDFDRAAAHVGDTDMLTAGGTNDIYFAKYAPDGALLWANQMLGAAGASGVARTVTTDTSGNFYLGGDFTGTISFGAFTLTSGAAKDGFVAKVGSDGTVLWANRWGAADAEIVNGITVDGAGNVYTAGSTSTKLQVEKFSASGTPLWAKQISGASGADAVGNGIDTDAAGNVYVGGGFSGKVDFDPGAGTQNVNAGANDNGFVLKLTAAGNYGWVSTFASQTSASYSKCNDLLVDGANNIIVGGSYYGSVDFKPGNGTYVLPTWVFPPGGSGAYSGPGFITKLNSAGALVWAQQVGSGVEGGGGVMGLALDSAGNVFATGIFNRTTDFDPGAGTNVMTSNGGTDVFVTKFSATGAYQWAVSVGGTGNDWARGIAVDGGGNVHVAGYFYNTVDFNPDADSISTLTSTGGSDGFLLKLLQF
ncbi:MAG: SBBP repeat-containing protein [Planctomycetia bacterium]|nr:SBBP repeat-containing protein [Planctomycetia bacterium]